jgi:hypothetical protein
VALQLVPFLVVIKITPLEALTPYIAVADASFNIEKLSISFGLIKVKGLLPQQDSNLQ